MNRHGNTADQHLNDARLLRREQLTPEPLEPLQRRDSVFLSEVDMAVAREGGQNLRRCLWLSLASA